MSKTDTLFLVALASIPIQLNKYIFPDFSFILGIPIDYRAIAIYFSDIPVVTFTIIYLFNSRKKFTELFNQHKLFICATMIFSFYLALSSVRTLIPSIWFAIKFLEWSLFGIAAAGTLSDKNIRRVSYKVIGFSLIVQSLIVMGQFIIQGSLGLLALGERSFNSSTTSIAHIELFGRQILRPYGTFPHPNITAAFLVLFLILYTSAQPLKKRGINLVSLLTHVATIICFSKAALTLLIIASTFFYKRLFLAFLSLIIAIGGAWIFFHSLPETQIASISERITLSQVAINIASQNSIFGIGSLNFIEELAKLNISSVSQVRLLQPVHNVFLLILAENGIIGFLLWAILLFSVSRYIKSKMQAILFVALLLYASVDHFLWTLQQGQLIFWTVIAYIVSFSNPSKTSPKNRK